ncbi:hypothetical protein M8818_004008 [Zalaria obscura]|uniref:Uncharacterized protein n=1 Tax=Zalaria obscura TaxID=2024903 RepID=A0ACC3SDA8_9PEZI
MTSMQVLALPRHKPVIIRRNRRVGVERLTDRKSGVDTGGAGRPGPRCRHRSNASVGDARALNKKARELINREGGIEEWLSIDGFTTEKLSIIRVDSMKGRPGYNAIIKTKNGHRV